MWIVEKIEYVKEIYYEECIIIVLKIRVIMEEVCYVDCVLVVREVVKIRIEIFYRLVCVVWILLWSIKCEWCSLMFNWFNII